MAARAAETMGPYDRDVKVEVKRFVTLSAIDRRDEVYDLAVSMVTFDDGTSLVTLCDMLYWRSE